ncbi:hypothetical protein HDV05_004425 [Chytridiales sp. JEL 0842]|nr:hypothetical protein HDV05_004425 [Chytridiales sp. JEL 0842]
MMGTHMDDMEDELGLPVQQNVKPMAKKVSKPSAEEQAPQKKRKASEVTEAPRVSDKATKTSKSAATSKSVPAKTAKPQKKNKKAIEESESDSEEGAVKDPEEEERELTEPKAKKARSAKPAAKTVKAAFKPAQVLADDFDEEDDIMSLSAFHAQAPVAKPQSAPAKKTAPAHKPPTKAVPVIAPAAEPASLAEKPVTPAADARKTVAKPMKKVESAEKQKNVESTEKKRTAEVPTKASPPAPSAPKTPVSATNNDNSKELQKLKEAYEDLQRRHHNLKELRTTDAERLRLEEKNRADARVAALEKRVELLTKDANINKEKYESLKKTHKEVEAELQAALMKLSSSEANSSTASSSPELMPKSLKKKVNGVAIQTEKIGEEPATSKMVPMETYKNVQRERDEAVKEAKEARKLCREFYDREAQYVHELAHHDTELVKKDALIKQLKEEVTGLTGSMAQMKSELSSTQAKLEEANKAPPTSTTDDRYLLNLERMVKFFEDLTGVTIQSVEESVRTLEEDDDEDEDEEEEDGDEIEKARRRSIRRRSSAAASLLKKKVEKEPIQEAVIQHRCVQRGPRGVIHYSIATPIESDKPESICTYTHHFAKPPPGKDGNKESTATMGPLPDFLAGEMGFTRKKLEIPVIMATFKSTIASACVVYLLALTSTTAQVITNSTNPGTPWTGTGTYWALFRSTADQTQCWDAQSFAEGSRVVLKPCNSRSFTQVFSMTSPAAGAVTMALVGRSQDLPGVTITLCVELGEDNVVEMRPCRRGNGRQVLFNLPNEIRFTTPIVTSARSICVGPTIVNGVGNTFGIVNPCNVGSAVNEQVTDLPIYFEPAGGVVTLATNSGNCIDATNPLQLVTRPCSITNSYQRWYHQWGQIRNVGSGQCINAAQSDGSALATTALPLSMSPCNIVPTPTQMLFLTRLVPQRNSFYFVNAESMECVYEVNGNVLLGTGLCDPRNNVLGNIEPMLMPNAGKFIPSVNNAQCQGFRTRMEFRDMTPAGKDEFFNGLALLQKTTSVMGNWNRFVDYQALHSIGRGYYHNQAQFLPWHRYFLMVLEKDLQTVLNNPNFGLPYWAWELDSTDWFRPEKGILSPDAFGTTGRNNPNGCVTDGRFRAENTDGQCLQRYFKQDGGHVRGGAQIYSEDFMYALMLNTTYGNFEAFRSTLESVPHGSIHQFVGYFQTDADDSPFGTMVSISTSTKDPTFWLHHNNLDRWFKYRQKLYPAQAMQYDGTRNYPARFNGNARPDLPAALTNIMPGFNVEVRVGMSLEIGDFCYKFQPSKNALQVVTPAFNGVLLRKRQEAGNGTTTSPSGGVNGTAVVITTPQDPVPAVTKPPPEKVKSVLDRIDTATNSVETDVNPQKHFERPPPRDLPAPLDERFIKAMGHDVAAFRKMEAEALKNLLRVRNETDKVLEKYFGTTFNETNYVVNAAATKLAVAHIVTGTKVE